MFLLNRLTLTLIRSEASPQNEPIEVPKNYNKIVK